MQVLFYQHRLVVVKTCDFNTKRNVQFIFKIWTARLQYLVDKYWQMCSISESWCKLSFGTPLVRPSMLFVSTDWLTSLDATLSFPLWVHSHVRVVYFLWLDDHIVYSTCFFNVHIPNATCQSLYYNLPRRLGTSLLTLIQSSNGYFNPIKPFRVFESQNGPWHSPLTTLLSFIYNLKDLLTSLVSLNSPSPCELAQTRFRHSVMCSFTGLRFSGCSFCFTWLSCWPRAEPPFSRLLRHIEWRIGAMLSLVTVVPVPPTTRCTSHTVPLLLICLYWDNLLTYLHYCYIIRSIFLRLIARRYRFQYHAITPNIPGRSVVYIIFHLIRLA